MDVKKLNPIAKTVASLIASVLTVLALFITLSDDGLLSTEDLMALGVAVVGGFTGTAAVYQVPNKKTAE